MSGPQSRRRICESASDAGTLSGTSTRDWFAQLCYKNQQRWSGKLNGWVKRSRRRQIARIENADDELEIRMR